MRKPTKALKNDVSQPITWYGRLTLQSPSWLRRYSHASRFRKCVELVNPASGDKVLDFGTGDAELIARLCMREPIATYVGFEPMEPMRKLAQKKLEMLEMSVELCSANEELSGRQFDKICCLEVLEHLPEALQVEALRRCAELLRPGGNLIVSVPIEIGIPAVVKAIVRWFTNSHGSVNWHDVFWCAVYMPHKVCRGAENYIPSHVGFDYRLGYRLINSVGLSIIATEYTPVHMFRGILNSQVFFVAVKPKRVGCMTA